MVCSDTGIQGHLEDSPPDHHRPIPKSLTGSFAQAGIIRERGLVHGGSAAEHAPDEEADGGADVESEADDASSVTSSGFMSLAANLAEARLGEEPGAPAVSESAHGSILAVRLAYANADLCFWARRSVR